MEGGEGGGRGRGGRAGPIEVRLGDPRFAQSPLQQKRLEFGPKARAGVQVVVTFVFLLALFLAFRSVPRVLAAQPARGPVLPEGAEPPGWVLLLVPALALIPGAYVFYFLKYNFNH
jgi:hypothetical protein